MYAADQDREEIVAFNTKSHKYHCLECTWAKKCTVNCVNIPKSEAIRRGGVPCKVCDGTCRSKLGRIPVEIEQNYRITYGDTVQSRVRGWAVRRNGSQ